VTATRIRKRIDRLTYAERQALLDAFKALMEDPNPATNYTSWVDIHAGFCVHKSGCFLPWHRAYLAAFEDALRATSPAAADVTLPFWDWTVIRRIPELVEQEALKRQRNDKADPTKLPLGDEIEAILARPDFELFGGRECSKVRVRGLLESYHSDVHNWVGFAMTTARSPDDPLFWFHHSYVDKLWHDWHGRHGEDPSCSDVRLPGIPGAWRIGDVLRIDQKRLGYGYADLERFAGSFEVAPDREPIRIQTTAGGVTGCRRILFDGVHVQGEGDPPAALEVRFADAPDDPIAVVSLFGLDHQARARVEADANHGPGHGGAPARALEECEHQHSDGFAAPLRFAIDTSVRSGRLAITAQWQPYSRQRAKLRFGSVTIGEI
jgi:tyrosinase